MENKKSLVPVIVITVSAIIVLFALLIPSAKPLPWLILAASLFYLTTEWYMFSICEFTKQV
jgi:putative exporter of polyketide antibiotics